MRRICAFGSTSIRREINLALLLKAGYTAAARAPSGRGPLSQPGDRHDGGCGGSPDETARVPGGREHAGLPGRAGTALPPAAHRTGRAAREHRAGGQPRQQDRPRHRLAEDAFRGTAQRRGAGARCTHEHVVLALSFPERDLDEPAPVPEAAAPAGGASPARRGSNGSGRVRPGYRVGYESPSQFSRECSRLFSGCRRLETPSGCAPRVRWPSIEPRRTSICKADGSSASCDARCQPAGTKFVPRQHKGAGGAGPRASCRERMKPACGPSSLLGACAYGGSGARITRMRTTVA